MYRSIVITAAAAIISISIFSFSEVNPKHRIVIQMSTGDTTEWKGTINNIRNLKQAWGRNADIELVAHGPGIALLQLSGSTQRKSIERLQAEGVVFTACENTLRERQIPKNDIIPGASFVPMGIGEVVLKQEQGWAYIKGGF